MSTKQRTRSTVIGLVAAVVVLVVGVAVGPSVVESLTGQPDVAPAGQPTQIMTAEDLTGVWAASQVDAAGHSQVVFFTFAADGTWSAGPRPEGQQWDTGSFTVEGSVLTLQTDPGGTCGGVTATYQMTSVDDGGLAFEVVQDECGGRAADMSGMTFTRAGA